MRYTLDKDGYILDVFFNCYSGSGGCKEYKGSVPNGYMNLDDWAENGVINAYKIDEDGNLVLDTNKEAYLKALYEEQLKASGYASKEYVNDKFNSASSVLADEISKNATSTGFLVLNDAGAYDIPKVKVEFKGGSKETLGNNLVENGEVIEMPLGTSRLNIANITEGGTYRFSCDSAIVSAGEENEYLIFLMDAEGNDIGEIYAEHSSEFKSYDFTITDEQIATYNKIIVRLYSSYSNETALENDVTYTNVKVQKVTSESVKTESVFIKTSNKNLLGSDLVNIDLDGVSVSVNEDKTITLNGTATADIELNLWANNTNSEMLFIIKKELDYYLSGLNDLELCFYAKDDDGLDLVYRGSDGLINLDEDKKITYITLLIKNEATFKSLVISPQLEYNNEATDYIQHEETKKMALDDTIENELKSYEDFTIIMLDNDLEFSIDYFTKKYFNNKFTEISSNIDEISLKTASNSENIDGLVESINNLVLTTDGLSNTLENRGGNNLIRNSYFCEFENGLLTFWSGPQKVVDKYESKSRNALSLQNGTLSQVISLTNKKYCFSFKYIKLTQVANAKVLVNNKEIVLDGDSDFENYIEYVVDLKSDNITIEFICDTDDGFLIYEPMLNEGDTASVFTQNASESISDTVNIGKGIEVLASNINNKTRIDADGIRGVNTETDELTFYQTTEGLYGKELETESIRSGNLIVTTRNGHNFLSGL